MNTKRTRELRNAVFSHIVETIRGELRDWDALEGWLNFDFTNEDERNMAAGIFRDEAKRLYDRIV